MLPVLTVNRSFMHDFMDAEPPCGALGLVEENGRQSGFVALHLDADIPSEVTARGFRLGHSLLGGDAFEVIHLAFAFYGFRTWNLLINPNNPLVQAVLTRMFEDEDYFFFALSRPDGRRPFAPRWDKTCSFTSKRISRVSGIPPRPRRSTTWPAWPLPATRRLPAPCSTGHAGTISSFWT